LDKVADCKELKDIMGLFDKIPENLFSILSSKNKSIYIDALFVVKESYKYALNVTRNDLNALLIAKLEAEIYGLVDDPEEEFMVSNADVSSKANFIIRKLIETEWLRSAFRGADFETIIELPDYSKKILDALEEILTEKTMEYNGLVVSTYNNLVALDRDRGDYAYQTLSRALLDTQQLIDLLKELYQNIGRYHQKAIEIASANELLKSHFDDFQEAIIIKFLHPFKTFDSVPRFKGPILEMLNRWYNDEDMLALIAKQALMYKAADSEGDAGLVVYGMISELLRLYEHLPELMREIDIRNNAYTRASIEKIQYLINRDRSVKGNLINVIKGINDGHLHIDQAMMGMQAYRQRYVTSDSLYARSKMTKSKLIISEPVKRITDASEKQATERFKSKLKETYGREAVIIEMMSLLKGNVINTSELPLNNDRDFSRVMLASLFGLQKSTPFQTTFTDQRFDNESYDLPMIEFTKKGGNDET